jgi:hypothetical protein
MLARPKSWNSMRRVISEENDSPKSFLQFDCEDSNQEDQSLHGELCSVRSVAENGTLDCDRRDILIGQSLSRRQRLRWDYFTFARHTLRTQIRPKKSTWNDRRHWIFFHKMTT